MARSHPPPLMAHERSLSAPSPPPRSGPGLLSLWLAIFFSLFLKLRCSLKERQGLMGLWQEGQEKGEEDARGCWGKEGGYWALDWAEGPLLLPELFSLLLGARRRGPQDPLRTLWKPPLEGIEMHRRTQSWVFQEVIWLWEETFPGTGPRDTGFFQGLLYPLASWALLLAGVLSGLAGCNRDRLGKWEFQVNNR